MTEKDRQEPFLSLEGVSGLSLGPECVFPASAGLRIIVGPNNAGKSRLLRKLAKADVHSPFPLADFPPSLERTWPKLRRDLTGSTAPVLVQEREPGSALVIYDQKDDDHPRMPAAFLTALAEKNTRHRHSNNNEDAVLHAELLGILPPVRLGTLVPSNRSFKPSFEPMNLGASLGDELEFSEWAKILYRAENAGTQAKRAPWLKMSDAFSEITEGLCLLFRFREDPVQHELVISEDGDERPLADCGEGLRDLVGVLMHVFFKADDDLFIDEPGIRLHPAAQRKLLQHLSAQSRNRAIWIATHDPAFAGAGRINERFSVRREKRDDGFVTEVSAVATRDEVVSLRDSMGWRPADVFLSDSALLCEGKSDRIAFEGALESLATRDATFGGIVVVDMDGCGALWEKGDKKQLRRTLSLASRIAPHAKVFALLDDDDKPPSVWEKPIALLREYEIAVEFLGPDDRHDLEHIWTAQGFLEALLPKLVENAKSAYGGEYANPEAADFLQIRNETLTSTGFNNWCGKARFDFDKIETARVAVELMQDAAHKDVLEDLERQVCNALGKTWPEFL